MIHPTNDLKAVLLSGLACVTITSCNAFGDGEAIRACESILVERLAAPATYTRVDLISLDPVSITLEDYHLEIERQFARMLGEPISEIDRQIALDSAEIDSAAGRSVAVYTILIQFDAQNAIGTSIRRTARCEYSAIDGQLSQTDLAHMRLDGMTRDEWIFRDLN